MTKVLVVEDDGVLRGAYMTKLNMEGYEVVEAFDGADGLEKALREQPDLILLDLLMPNVDGIEFLRRFDPKGKHPEIKVVVFSNFSVPEKINEAMKLGADKYYVKANISPKAMMEIIRQTLAERKGP